MPRPARSNILMCSSAEADAFVGLAHRTGNAEIMRAPLHLLGPGSNTFLNGWLDSILTGAAVRGERWRG